MVHIMVFNETGALRGRSANDFFLPPLGRVGEDRGAERAGLRRRVGLHPLFVIVILFAFLYN